MKKGRAKGAGPYTVSKTDDIILGVDEFPCPTELTFEHLIDHWRRQAKMEGSIFQAQIDQLEKKLERVPELTQSIRDLSILEEHKDILELMIAPFFPVYSGNTEMKALSAPFSDRFFYTSQHFEKVIGHRGSFVLREENKRKKNLTVFWRLLYAYRAILADHYQLTLVVDQPMIYTIPHQRTGLDRYYKLNSQPSFIRWKKLGPLPDLDRSTFDYLVDNFHNMDLWMEYLPPEKILFTGFTIHSFVDVSVEEATARLEHICTRQRISGDRPICATSPSRTTW